MTTLDSDIRPAPRPRRESGRRVGAIALRVLLPALTLAGLVGLWWLATIVFDWEPFLVPTPKDAATPDTEIATAIRMSEKTSQTPRRAATVAAFLRAERPGTHAVPPPGLSEGDGVRACASSQYTVRNRVAARPERKILSTVRC